MTAMANETGGLARAFFRFSPWIGAAVLLAAPAVAMQYTREVDWTATDFVTAAVMFLSVLVPWELAMRASRNFAYLAGVAVTLGTAFILVWGTLAVGIIGSENNDANLMFFGVLALAVGGSAVAAFRPAGMAWAMFAAAIAQATVGVIALAGGMGVDGESWPKDVIFLTVFFTLLWTVAGGLFRRAAGADLRAA